MAVLSVDALVKITTVETTIIYRSCTYRPIPTIPSITFKLACIGDRRVIVARSQREVVRSIDETIRCDVAIVDSIRRESRTCSIERASSGSGLNT